jgi:formylglycine-generating enzyme required for sulfatase activity
MIFHSHRNVKKRAERTQENPSRVLWNGWRRKWLALKEGEGSVEQLKYYQEILGGFMPCPPGDQKTCRFTLHQFTVTNGQYELFEPFHERAEKVSDDSDQPVVNVSFWDSYCCAVWMGYRLPTSEEWEFACRAGSTAEYSFGNGRMNNGTQANCDGIYPDQSDQYGPYLRRTVSLAEVALEFEGCKIRYEANAWGLWHMHGNVWEWCNTKYDNDRYIVRGGSWGDGAGSCRGSHRFRYVSGFRTVYFGFRLASCLDFG